LHRPLDQIHGYGFVCLAGGVSYIILPKTDQRASLRAGMRLDGKTIAGAAAAVAFLSVQFAAPWASSAAEPPAPSIALFTNLPVVARPPAQQPATGLPADTHLDKTPPRQTVGLDLVRNGWTYNCMECHKLIPARWHYDRPLNEHQNIRLEHGNNRFCLNCHHPSDRNAFVDYDGTAISQSDVVLLCGKCHGTIYRDWEAGAHGRQNGYWNPLMGARTKLRCIQCHDPHRPQFQPMKPLPPPKYPPRAAHPPAARDGAGPVTMPHE